MGGKQGPETSTKELRDKSSRRGIHEHRDGSINRDRDVRVRFCAGPVECATKPLSTPPGWKFARACSTRRPRSRMLLTQFAGQHDAGRCDVCHNAIVIFVTTDFAVPQLLVWLLRL